MLDTIHIYVKSKLAKSWINDLIKDLSFIYNFRIYNSLESLKNELDFKTIETTKFNNKIIYVIIDVEDIHYSLYTKSYFSSNDNIKFIGIGNKKDINQLIEIIKNNIFSYIRIGNNFFEIIKAFKSIENKIAYFCEESKDHLLANYLKDIKSNSKINFSYSHNNTKDIVEEFNDIEALTEKEKKVTSLLLQGLTYKEIANLLGVTIFAINQNTKSIYRKLRVRSRGELSYRMSG